jgi:hypothetical protein
MTDTLEQLRRRVAELELQQLAMLRAFETAAQSGDSQLASLNDVYTALFTAHTGLKAIDAALAHEDRAEARRLVHFLLLRLREYDHGVSRLPFADLRAGSVFRHGGGLFRKVMPYTSGKVKPANAVNVDDGNEAWFEDDVLVIVGVDDE